MSSTVQFIGLFLLVLGPVILCAWPLGVYMARVLQGKSSLMPRFATRIEQKIYQLCGIDPHEEMGWAEYAIALLIFNLGGGVLVYALQRLQQYLPFNPEHLSAVGADSSFNTAVSFVTNTDWQGYSGESTMGYLTQAAGFGVQNFLSAATGIAVAIALIRGFTHRSSTSIGNFWVDLTRSTLFILLPLAILLAVLLVGQGVIQNVHPYQHATTLEPLSYDSPKVDADGNAVLDAQGKPVTEPAMTQTQTLPMGPLASQEAIKLLGTNGGGFFNANSAHPYENPNAVSNLLETAAILLIPIALTFTFGILVGDRRQGHVLLAAMLLLLTVMTAVAFMSEQAANPQLANHGIDAASSALQSGGNMEGKETRFGITASALFAAVTTATSCGAVNSMHDSLMPMGGFVTLFLMQLGELTPGGVGTGLYTILIFAILSVFIAGLMIGRTPEYLGKKIQSREMKLASIFILTTPTLVLAGTAIAVLTEAGKAGVLNPGPHGFSEILYAFTSAGNNNGSAFGGLSVNTVFYNVALGIVMWLGRFWPIIATLAIAGSLAAKKRLPVTEGTMPTDGPLFTFLLIGTIVLIGVLNYVPALALGPLVENFMLSGAH